MMFQYNYTYSIVALLLSSLHQVQAENWNGRTTPVTCSICRDANRPILNPTKSFTMNNGNTWTCNYLQETVQDVDANSLYENERLMCARAQLQGEYGGCQCGGDANMAPIQSQVTQLNPPCDLCAGQASSVVPSSNYDTAVATSVGRHNCQGLYFALASGIVSEPVCPVIQRAAGATCCGSSSGSSLFDFSSSGSSSSFSRRPTTLLSIIFSLSLFSACHYLLF